MGKNGSFGFSFTTLIAGIFQALQIALSGIISDSASGILQAFLDFFSKN